MSAIYKVVLNGEYGGKDNQCTLWYRTAIDMFSGAFGFGGAEALADNIESTIVDRWLACKPPAYTLQTIDIYPHNDLLALVYQNPYIRSIQQPGASVFTGGADSSALAVNLKFNLEPVMFGVQRVTAPKRGYLAIGPIPSLLLNDNGKLVDDFLTQGFEAWKFLKDVLTQNLVNVVPPAIFFPIRVSRKWGMLDGLPFLESWGWADVQGGSYDQYATFRRSRRIKG